VPRVPHPRHHCILYVMTTLLIFGDKWTPLRFPLWFSSVSSYFCAFMINWRARIE
jgi:hypothetical protein